MIKTAAYCDPNIESWLFLRTLYTAYEAFQIEDAIVLNFVGTLFIDRFGAIDIDITNDFKLEYFIKILEKIQNKHVIIANWNDTPRDTLYQKSFRKSIINNMNYTLLNNGNHLLYILACNDNTVMNEKCNVFEGIKQFSSEDFYLDADCNIWHKKNGVIKSVKRFAKTEFIVWE